MSSSVSILESTAPPFLTVPLELRRQIYGYLVPIWNGVIRPSRGKSWPYLSGYQGLMITNRQINQELSSMLYRDFMIPIRISCIGIYLLDFWATTGHLSYQPLSAFDFRKVRKLDITIGPSERTVKCVANLRANMLNLSTTLQETSCTMDHLRILGSHKLYSLEWILEWVDGGNVRPASSLVNGIWDTEVVMQPFRTLHGVRTVEIELSQQALTIPEMEAWKEALQQVIKNPTPCDETVFAEVRLLTAKAKRALERWKFRERYNRHYHGPEYTHGMYDSEQESYEKSRWVFLSCVYSDDSEVSVEDTHCVRKVRGLEALCSSDDCGDREGGEEDEGENGEKVYYRDGIRVGNFCS